MDLYDVTIPQFQKTLAGIDKWLTAAEEHAKKKSFDPNTLLSARLAPDQFALVRQVQSACDGAKGPASLLVGKVPPKHPDTETTLAELHARIATVQAYLETITRADFEGAETRKVELGFLPGKYVLGADYAIEMAMPNFYFHVTTTYAILRHNGVDLGKRDFIGGLKTHDK